MLKICEILRTTTLSQNLLVSIKKSVIVLSGCKNIVEIDSQAKKNI